jgi:hypothetical protein
MFTSISIGRLKSQRRDSWKRRKNYRRQKVIRFLPLNRKSRKTTSPINVGRQTLIRFRERVGAFEIAALSKNANSLRNVNG